MNTTENALSALATYDHENALYQVHKHRMMLMAEARNAGATWEQIGEAMGMTRQSANELWHRSAGEVMAKIREANAAARAEGR